MSSCELNVYKLLNIESCTIYKWLMVVQSSSDLTGQSGKRSVHGILDDTVNRMVHFAYIKHTFEIGRKVLTPINQ